MQNRTQEKRLRSGKHQPVVPAKAADMLPLQQEMPFPSGEEIVETNQNIQLTSEEQQAPTVEDEHSRQGFSLDVKMHLPAARTKKLHLLPQTSLHLTNSGSSKELLLQKVVPLMGQKSNQMNKQSRSPIAGRASVGSTSQVMIVANEERQSKNGPRPGGKQNLSLTQSAAASDQQVVQQLGKPSLKLLMAQQTVKPDPAAKSPPITSNCQSQSSIATTQTRNSPKSSISNTASKQKTRNIQNSLGQLLQQTTNMFAKQQAITLKSHSNNINKSQQHHLLQQSQQQFPKTRKATNYKNLNQAWQTMNPNPSKVTSSKHTHQTHGNQQPRVGKQLNDMLVQEGRPSMTGDIDDVANLISPSPRRNPGKIHSANRSSCLMKLETGEHMVHSLMTEENAIEVEQLRPHALCIDSFDGSLNINEFGSDILTPQLSATSGDFKTLKQAQMNPKTLIHGSKQPNQSQRPGQNIQKQPISSKTTSHHYDAQPKRQVPLQSSIETKKLTNKHPNNSKTTAVSVKPFNAGPVTQASKSSSNKAMVFESSAASLAKTPKLFAGKQSKQLNKHAGQAKASLAQKRLTQQQSCDVIISTDGNVSDLDHLNEGRQMNVVGKKKAFELFGPSDSFQHRHLETEQTTSMVITRANESVNHLSRSLFSLEPQKKQSKMSIVPKQIEIELTFDGSKTQAQQLQANFQKNNSIVTPGTSKNQKQSHTSQTTKNSHIGAEMQTTVLNSFSNNNQELPLEERAPNTAVANQNIDLSLKTKTRQKFLNQTVIEKQKSNQSSKIQPVPTLSLNSFKSRPMAPVTSRNMSNAASLVKKANPAQVRNPNFKRSNNHAAPAKDDNCKVVLQPSQQTQDMSPLILQTKTLESFPAVADPQNKGILPVDKAQSLTNHTNKVRGKLTQNGSTHKKKNAISSSVDARRAFHSNKPTSVPRDEKNVQQRFSQLQKFSQANISIDLTMQNTQEDHRGSLKRNSETNPQYKTESLERILGSQAESYFRQIERTIQMGPVNVSQSQNRSQRQASCSQSSRLSGKTGKETQMSLTLPGGSQSFGMTLGSQKHQRVQNALVLEPRLASADKKSSFELTKINTTTSQSQSRPVHDTSNLLSRPSGGMNRDRFVAHRRIDLICDENADSTSHNTKGSLSNSLIKADHLNLSKGNLTRKKSDSISSGRDVAATTPGGPKQSKPLSVKAVQSSSGKPESLGRKNQQALGGTRNSKSSFGSNTRLQQSSKQSIAKDWVICLPNEPPKVIETQPDESSLKVEKLMEQKSAKKDSSIILHSEKSTSTRGGKSLLHPSAQKKMQQRMINASSKESMENSQTTQKTNLTKRSTMGNKAAQMAATIVRNDHRQLQVPNTVKTTKKQEIQKHPKIELNEVLSAHQNSLNVSKQLSEVAKVVNRQPIVNSRKSQNSQRSSSSLQITAQVSYNSKRQRDEQVIVDQATASYLNLSNTNMSEVQARRPKSRQSLCTTSNKDQTSSHRALKQYARDTLNQRESFVEQKSLDTINNKSSHNYSTNKKLRSSLVSQVSNTNNNNHDLLFVTTDDEAAQYYDKLTSLFQETRQKIKEFNNDFSRGKQKERFIGGGTYDVLVKQQRSSNKKQSYSSQLSSLDEPMTKPRESILSQEIRKDGKNTTKASQLARREMHHNHHRTGSNSNSNFTTGSMISQSSHHRRQNQLNDSEKRQRERKPLQMNTDILGETDAEYEERKRTHNKESHMAKKARKSSYIELNDERKKQQSQGPKMISSARKHAEKAQASHMQGSAQKQKQESSRASTVKSKVMAEESNAMVDNYYQTNDESVDFMVSSKSKKIDAKLKSPQDASKQPGHIASKKMQAKGTKHSLTEMASTQTSKPLKARRNIDTVQEPKVSTGHPQQHDQHSTEQLSSQATQPLPTNATIYINNLMNGVQTTQEDYQSSTMIGIPSQEMCRTQSHTIYPTSQQIFNSQQSVASGQQFYNAMNHHQAQQMHHQQYPHPHQMLQQNHNPQQQIVFVPVPVIQNSQSTIHSVPSAPQFMPSTHSQLNYQFPTQMSGPLFPPQNHSPQAAHAAALYAAAATMTQPGGQHQNSPFTYTMQQPGQTQNQQFYQTHSHISAPSVQQNQLFSGSSNQTRHSQQVRQSTGQQARSRQAPLQKQDQAVSGTSKQKSQQASCQNCNIKTNSGKTTTAQCKKAK